MTVEEKKNTDNEYVIPEPDTTSQGSPGTTAGTESVNEAIHEQEAQRREKEAQEEEARRREKARKEVEDYINSGRADTA